MNLSLVVLAAGMGSRYGGLKQMDPIGPNGETVLDYSVYDAWRAGFNKVVFVIRKDFHDLFERTIGGPLAGKVRTAYAHQEIVDLPGNHSPPADRTKPWGTAHAIWSARHRIDEPFCVINADDFYGAGAFRALRRFFSETEATGDPLPCSLVAYRLRNTLSDFGGVSRGILDVSPDGYLRGVSEQTDIRAERRRLVSRTAVGEVLLDPDSLVSMNCWGFQPAIFEHFERRIDAFLQEPDPDPKREIYVADPVETAIRERKATFRVLPNEGFWFGVTYKEDKERAVAAIRDLIAGGSYPERLWT